MSFYDQDDSRTFLEEKMSPSTIYSGDALSLPQTIIHGAVASIGDLAATTWNSITPESMNTSTEALLQRIDEDALNVYNENKDTINTISFVGGLVAPVGLSMKMMGMLRSGAKGANWFSKAGQTERLAEVENAFTYAGANSQRFSEAKNAVYKATAANMLTDSIAAEAAINLTLNAHPFMEDYYKDPAKNFLIGTAFGGVLGGVVGHIGDRAMIAAKTIPLEKELTGILRGTIVAPDVISQGGTQIAQRTTNIENLTNVLARNADPADAFTISEFTKRGITYTRDIEQGKLIDDFTRIWRGDLTKMPVESRDNLIKLLDDTRFGEVDAIGYAEVKEALSPKGSAGADGIDAAMSKVANFFTLGKNKAGEETVKQIDAIYSPIYNSFVSKSEAANYLTAADLGIPFEKLEKLGKDEAARMGKALRDHGFTLSLEHSALADKDAIIQVLAAKKQTLEQINKMVFDPEDVAAIKAVYARALKLEQEAGIPLNFTVKLTKQAPNWDVQEKLVLQKAGLDPNYAVKLRGLAKDWNDVSLHRAHEPYRNLVSHEAETALSDWISGSYDFLRRGAIAMHELSLPDTGGLRTALDSMTSASRNEALQAMNLLQEIKGSKQSIELRKRLADFADGEGNVWLYRGLRGEPNQHLSLESYTILSEKAAEFGQSSASAVKMYKVGIDDIIGTVHDFGAGKKPEILVVRPTRDFGQVSKSDLDRIPDELVVKEAVEMTKIAGADRSVQTLSSLDDILNAVENATLNQIKDLQSRGFGIETIAIKTATPEETIASIISGSHTSGTGLFKYLDDTSIAGGISQEKRALQIKTNPYKMEAAQLFGKLDSKNGEAMSAQLVEYYLSSNSSHIVRDLAGKLYDDESRLMVGIINSKIEEVTQAGLKSTLFRSVNTVVENFGEAGVFAAELGKKVVHMKNMVKEMFEKPLAQTMGSIAKSQVDTIEANTLMNAYAAQKNTTIWKAGSLWEVEAAAARTLVEMLHVSDDEFLKWAASAGKMAGEDAIPNAKIAKYRGAEVTAQGPLANQLMEQFQEYGRHMYEMNNAYRQGIGGSPLPDRGLWIPAFSTHNKQFVYVVDMVKKETSMIYANSIEELNSSVIAYQNSLIGRNPENIKIIPKEKQALVAKLMGRTDVKEMSIADIGMKHSGSSQYTIIPTNTTMMTDALSGYAYRIDSAIDNIVELQLASTMDHLKTMSDLSANNFSKASLSTVEALKNKPADPGQVMRNTILGKSNLSEHRTWAEWQQRTQVWTDIALESISEVMKPITQSISKAQSRTPSDWIEIEKQLKANGIPNPFDSLDQAFARGKYMADATVKEGNISQRAITLSNSLAATALLKFMEIAQPFVNAISLPILTTGAMNRKMLSSFGGSQLDPLAKFSIQDSMYGGLRLMNHPTGEKYLKMGEEAGVFKSMISEATELMSHAKSLNPGAMGMLEDGLERVNKSVLTKPSEWSEELVRKMSFMTGIHTAKKAYPGISDSGAFIFARNFMDESVGNYFAPQRPAAFHGTFGTAIGLFQTYMLTLAQQMYRGVETKNWKALGKQMFAQSSIFGYSSLPGFSQVSEGIATHFSDGNIDLETGTFRALPDMAANMLLYGIPSSLGPGIVTRGDIQPRIPNPLTGVDSIAAVNFATQSYQALERIAMAAAGADEHAGRAVLEAISLQSMNRPLARMSELINGYSVTRSGDKVYGPSEMYTPLSLISRVMSTRPLEEIKLREMMHLNTVYGAADANQRKAATTSLKMRARNGELTDEKYTDLMERYLRTGTPNGWKAAVNTAVAQTNKTGREVVLDKMTGNNPLSLMVDDLH